MNLKKRFFLFLMIVFIALGVVACSNASNSVTVNFGKEAYTVKEGASIALDVNIKDNDEYSAAAIKGQLVYSVKDETVAVVDEFGNLTGVGSGETEVKVEWSEKAIVFDLAKVTVLLAGVPEVEFSGFNPNMLKGATQTINYSFVPALTDATVSYESANPEVATVDANGKITAVKVGEATIIMYVMSGEETGSKVLKVNVSESDFAINYNLDGGNNAEANPAGYNTLETPVALAAPTKTGYDFAGWYADPEFATAYAEVPAGSTGDVTVYAKFDIHNYAISYDLDGGTNGANPATYTVNDEVVLADATKDSYKFLGWFNASDEKVTKIAKGSTGDVALKAKFEVNAFAITYNLDGGHFVLPYLYQNQYEMACDFAVDFKAHTGKVITVTGDASSFTVDFFARSYSGGGDSLGYNFLTSAEYGAKWGWMLEVINANRIARGKAALAPTDGQAEARGDCNNFLELSNGRGQTAGYGGDYSTLKFEDYAPTYLKVAAGFIYNDLAAMEKAFLADYGHHSSASQIATATSESSWMTAFLTNEAMMAKWGYLFDYIYEVNGEPEGYAKEDGANARFFYMCNVNGFFSHKQVKSDYSASIPSYDYSTVKYADFAGEYLVDPLYGHLGLDVLEKEFLADYGHHTAASQIATATSESSWMTAFLTNEAMMTKWGWLFDYIYEVNGRPEGYAKEDGANARFFYMCNVNGFFNKKQVKSDYSASIPSFDYSTADPADYVEHLPIDYSIVREAPTTYSPATGAIIPNPVKENNVFAGWGTLVTTIDTTASKGFWSGDNYTHNIYLYRKGSNEQALFSDRIGLSLNEDGTYSITQLATSGAAYTYDSDDLTIMISGSNTNYAALHVEFLKLALGQTVGVSGSTKTGVATVKFYTIDANPIPAGSEGNKTLNAVFCEVKDENALSYVLDGAKLSADAPDEYSTVAGLALTMTASKDGYVFKGWSLSKGGSIVTEIAAGTRGDLDLYPVFEAIEYTIEYDCNGGSFTKIEIVNAYDSFDDLVADFLADYSAKFGVTGLTAANFNTKSSSYGLVGFWKDTTLAAKWAWLKQYILNYSSVYSGLSYLKNDSNASNFNKYWRANITAFLTQSKLTSPMTMDFTGCVDDDFWTENGLKKDESVIINPKLTYTADDLPLELQQPMRDDHTFLGWCDNDYYKREMLTLPEGTLGDIKLYAKWDDTQALVEMKKINYELNGGELGINSPAEFEVDKGINLVDPTKTGYKFLGWSTEKGGTAYITAVPTTQMDDITVYANWEVIDYTIEYVLPEGVYFQKETTTVVLNPYSDIYSKTNTKIHIDKFDSMRSLGGIATYEGVLLMRSSVTDWPSGLASSKKVALKDLGNGVYEVVEINTSDACKVVLAKDNVDMIITAFNGSSLGYNTIINGFDVAVGDLIGFSVDLDTLTPATAVDIEAVKLQEAKNIHIDKFDSMRSLGGIATYEGVLLMRSSVTDWPSGLASSKKVALKDLGNGKYEVVEINTSDACKVVLAKDNVDMIITAFNGSSLGYNTIINGFDVAVGNVITFSVDLDTLTPATAVDIKAYVVEEAPSIHIDKFDSMRSLGGIATYEGVLLMRSSVTDWPSGLASSKKVALKDLGNGKYEVVEINTSDACKVVLAKDNVDMIITAFNGSSLGYNTIINGFDVAVGDLIGFSVDLDTLTPATAVDIKAYKVTKEMFETTTVKVDVAHPVEYNVEELPLALVDPIIELEGKAFFGWFEDENFYSEKLTAIPAGKTGNIKLYPRIENEGFVEQIKSAVEYDLDGGEVTGELSPIYYEGTGLTLPTPKKDGFTFVGWLLNDKNTTDYVTSIPATQTGAVKVYAIWYETPTQPVGPVDHNYYVGADKTYQTIDDAIAAAVAAENDEVTIVVDAGDYTLTSQANIGVTLVGPNAEVAGYGDRASEAKIVIPQLTVNFAHLVFKGVTIDSEASNKNVFFPQNNCSEIAFYNCIIKDSRQSTAYGINTFLRDTDKKSGTLSITFDGNDISYIGQFLSWTSITTDYNFTNNHLLLTGSGAVGSSAYNTALFRLRKGDFTFVGNTFVGNLISNPYLFEFSGGGNAVVKYNTFDATNVGIFDNTSACTKDIEGNLCINSASFAADTKQSSDAAQLEAGLALYKNAAGALVVGEGQTYTTIAAALDAASDGSVIYVCAGTYEEELTITKAVTIKGANCGVKGAADRANETIITKAMTIEAAVTLDGLKFTADGTITIKASNVTIKNIVDTANKIAVPDTNRKAQIVIASAGSDYLFEANYFDNGSEQIYCCGAIGSNSKVADATFINNTFDDHATTKQVNEAIVLYVVDGKIVIKDNLFNFRTDNWMFCLGQNSGANTCSEIIIENNIFQDNGVGTGTTSGFGMPYVSQTATVKIIHNYFKDITGSTIRFRYDKGGANIIIAYNVFENTAIKIPDAPTAGTTFTFDTNSYATVDVANNVTLTDLASNFTKTDADAAYKAYLAGQEIHQVVISKINYELNGGKLDEIVYVYEEGKKVVLPNPTKEDYKFLGWTLNEGTAYVKEIGKDVTGDVTLHAHFRFDGITVGEGQDYATLTEALGAAKDGDIIYVYPGTYEESIDVKASVTINAVNNYKYVLTDDAVRGEESIITGKVTISAKNVTLNGLSFGETGTIQVDADNATLNALYSLYEGSAQTNAFIAYSENTGLKLTNTYAKMTGTSRLAAGTEALENAVFDNNKLIGTEKTGVYCDLFRFQTITGSLTITNNYFSESDQFTLFLGSTANTCGEIIIENNVFENTGKYSSVIELRACKAGQFVSVLHNTFKGIQCSKVLNLRGTVTAGCQEVSYNKFMDPIGTVTTYLTSNNVAEAFTLVDNYFATAPTSSSVQTTVTGYTNAASAAAADEAYETYLKNTTRSKITYVLDGGKFTLSPKGTYVEGQEMPLATPSKDGYTFLGWSLTPDFAEFITKIPATQKGDITLYARLVILKKLTFNLDEGTLENTPATYIQGEEATLPVPTKTGYRFMGWYDNASFNGDPITKIEATTTGDLSLYALWQIEGSFNMTFVLNGGNTLFTSRDEMVDAFMADFQANVKSSTGLGNFFDSSYGKDAADICDFLVNQLDGKWAWLYDYLEAALEVRKPTTSTATDPTQATLQNNAALIRGTLHNFLNANDSSAYGCSFKEFNDANGFWDKLQTEVEGSFTEIITPSRYGYTFEGWYDNAELSGNAVRSLTADGTLYAKFVKIEPTLTYVLCNEEATMENTTVKFQITDAFDLATPSFNKKHYSFAGWYLEPTYETPISDIKMLTFEDVTVYGKWVTLEGFTINYVLNGGQWTEPSAALYNQIVAEFKADYAKSGMTVTSWYGETKANYEKLAGIFLNSNHKWDWLLKYWAGVNTCTYSGETSASRFLALMNGTQQFTVQNGYAIAVECNAFINSFQTSVYSSALKSANYGDELVRNKIWDYYTLGQQATYINCHDNAALLTPYKANYNFDGWYLSADFSGNPITVSLEEDTNDDGIVTYYAKWVEGTPVTSVTITNQPTTIDLFGQFQLTWAIEPANANFQGVTFKSSDPTVVTVSDKGVLFGAKNGKATITVTSESISGAKAEFEVEVITPAHWNVSYVTESYVPVGDQIELAAEYVNVDGTKPEIVWSTTTPELVEVSATGVVTALAEGLAKVVATVKDTETTFEFTVTVLSDELSDAIQYVVDNHYSNAVEVYNLGIGAGTPAYYLDIIGSVSKILYNEELIIDERFKASQDAISTNHGTEMTSVEFITVHYTGNMAKTSDGDNNAEYFAGGGGGTSIHYVTGSCNNQYYAAFYCLDEKYGGYHASDSAQGEHVWVASGIKVEDDDPRFPTISVADGYLTINGKKTNCALPARSDGIVVTGPTFDYYGQTINTINDMGLAWTVIGDEYYLGNYWWGSQATGNPLCNIGGNRNSIGIESAVDLYSDLWHTWMTTSQLVANLMVKHDLGIERVVGHHFFSGKDCPQPLLRNDLQLWKEFVSMVEAEYEMITTWKDAEFKMNIVEGNGIASKVGRLVQGKDAEIVTYEVEVTVGGVTEKVTLATAVNGTYSDPCDCDLSKLSIQKTEGAILYIGESRPQ